MAATREDDEMPNPPRPARTRLPRLNLTTLISILLGLSAFSLVAATGCPAKAQAAALAPPSAAPSGRCGPTPRRPTRRSW